MALTLTTQLIEDGNRNVVLRVTATGTGDLAQTTLVDPALLSPIGPYNYMKASFLRVDKIDHDIDDGVDVQLLWDGTTPAVAFTLYGRKNMDFKSVGGLPNVKPAGATGRILIQSTGVPTDPPTGTFNFSILLWLIKQ